MSKSAHSETQAPDNVQSAPKKETYDDLLAKLKDKHARFVEEYLIDLNATQAALRAGYTELSARKQSYRLLANIGVKAAIDAGKAEIAARTRINQDEVIKELCRIGFARVTDYLTFDADGVHIKGSDQLTDDQVAAIASVSDETFGPFQRTIKFKLHDKVKSLLGVLERVKPGADKPMEHKVTLTNFPPEPKTMEEWERLVKQTTTAVVTGGK